MYCLLGHFVGNPIKHDVTKMIKIAVSFECDTPNAFSTPSCRANTGTNSKKLQNVGKDPEQIMVGCFHELKN